MGPSSVIRELVSVELLV